MATIREAHVPSTHDWLNFSPGETPGTTDINATLSVRSLTITLEDIFRMGDFVGMRLPGRIPLELHLPRQLLFDIRREVDLSYVTYANPLEPLLHIAGIVIVGSYDQAWALLTSSNERQKARVERLWFTEHPIGRALVATDLEDRIWSAKSERAAIARDALLEDGILQPREVK